LTRDEFLARFGDIAEHSPSIAAAVFDAGLPPGALTADALGARFSAAIRTLPEAAQTDFLNAHPDLAGKLHAAGQLTEDSAREQAGAGLDLLTDAERARFLALNDAYRARFGFPFIIAVKGLDKAAILAAFEARLAHDVAAERDAALRQIDRIQLLRLRARLAGTDAAPAG
jgi:OHCU decarboxylase